MQFIKTISLSIVFLVVFQADQHVLKLNIEPNHSTIGFKVPIAGGITKVRGKFTDFQLYMDYVDEDLTRSKARFVIQAKSIDTGIEDRDNHLRSKDFFDVAQYPEVTFESSSIKKSGEGYTMEGTLTMHGVSRQVSIPFRVNKLSKSQVAVSIEWKLNRKDYGVGVGFKHTSIKNFISDEIGVEIDFWTRKAKVQSN